MYSFVYTHILIDLKGFFSGLPPGLLFIEIMIDLSNVVQSDKTSLESFDLNCTKKGCLELSRDLNLRPADEELDFFSSGFLRAELDHF